MKIEGIRQLDQNFYETITVRYGVIKVSGKVLDTVTLGKSFSESLRGKSDEEIRKAVIEYFMDYNRLNFISDDFSRVTGPIYYVGSESGKLLLINDQTSEGEKKRIIDKYVRDRYYFLYNHPSDMYGLNVNYGDTSSYSITRSGSVKFNLSRNNGILPEYESTFVERFLDEIFRDEVITVVKPKNDEKYKSNYELVANGKRVILGMMNKDILKKVEEHNRKCDFVRKENEDALKMQLKMEGF